MHGHTGKIAAPACFILAKALLSLHLMVLTVNGDEVWIVELVHWQPDSTSGSDRMGDLWSLQCCRYIELESLHGESAVTNSSVLAMQCVSPCQ